MNNKLTYQELEIQIAELKKQNENLLELNKRTEESERKLKAALGSMSDAVFISDTEGNFIDFNEAFATFHKFRNKQECAKTLNDYPHFLDVYFPNGELAAFDQWVVPRALRGENGTSEEFTLVRKDTNEKWVGSYNFGPILNSEGIIIGAVVSARDITKIKKKQSELLRAKEKAEENEKIYRAVFNSIPDTSILLFDKDLRYIEVGGDEVEKSGFDKSLIKGKTLQEAYPKDVVDLFEPLLQKGFKGEATTFEMEYAQLTYLQQIVPISDNSGDVFATMQIATNITEKHAAEQTLKNSQLLLKSSIESQKDTILLSIDKDYRYLYFNSAHAKGMKYAYGKEIEVGMNILDCISSDEDRAIANDNYDRALRGETHTNVRVYGKENLAYYESFFNPILNDKNEIIGATGLARDISERKKAEETLLENQRRYEKSQELAHVGNWEYNPELKLFWVSNESKRIYGFDLDSNNFDIEQIESCIPGRERVHQALIDLVENDKEYDLEFEIIPADKSPRKIIHSIAGLEKDKNNNPLRVRGVILDITIQKNIEQLLKESNALKDKFFSIIAHDLRSPFNNIIGFTELLIENTKDFGDPEFAKYLDIINSTANSTLVLLDNLLNWAKSQTGKIYFHPEKLILSTIIQEIFTLSNPIAQKKNIVLNYSESEEITVFADQNMIKTILRNLISNAIKFTNSHGKIDVYASQVDKNIEIAVSDNGVGIDEETKKKLFSLASNESTLGTANEKGTGLGLILCKDFVEKHGGKIWVESKLGKGSTFKFKLPSKKINEGT